VYTVGDSVGIRELRQQTSAVLRLVKSGMPVDITEHGHPVARIVPYVPDGLERMIAEGRVSEADGDLLELLDELGLPREPQSTQLPTEALAELRADER
jgi:prevent-host-death family protein